MPNDPVSLNSVIDLATNIEKTLIDYCAVPLQTNVAGYIQCFSDEFLSQTCSEALNLPASCIVDERSEDLFIGIHVNISLIETVNAHPSIDQLVSTNIGLNAFLTLIEEISHFHHILNRACSNSKISRFDLELQAEVEKAIIASIVVHNAFGKSHVQEIVTLLFDHSVINGTLTNYALASKLAERFLKENINQHGPNVIYDPRFRKLVQKAANYNGSDKIEILSTKLSAA
jgi:hypothetical protein